MGRAGLPRDSFSCPQSPQGTHLPFLWPKARGRLRAGDWQRSRRSGAQLEASPPEGEMESSAEFPLLFKFSEQTKPQQQVSAFPLRRPWGSWGAPRAARPPPPPGQLHNKGAFGQAEVGRSLAPPPHPGRRFPTSLRLSLAGKQLDAGRGPGAEKGALAGLPPQPPGRSPRHWPGLQEPPRRPPGRPGMPGREAALQRHATGRRGAAGAGPGLRSAPLRSAFAFGGASGPGGGERPPLYLLRGPGRGRRASAPRPGSRDASPRSARPAPLA